MWACRTDCTVIQERRTNRRGVFILWCDSYRHGDAPYPPTSVVLVARPGGQGGNDFKWRPINTSYIVRMFDVLCRTCAFTILPRTLLPLPWRDPLSSTAADRHTNLVSIPIFVRFCFFTLGLLSHYLKEHYYKKSKKRVFTSLLFWHPPSARLRIPWGVNTVMLRAMPFSLLSLILTLQGVPIHTHTHSATALCLVTGLITF